MNPIQSVAVIRDFRMTAMNNILRPSTVLNQHEVSL